MRKTAFIAIMVTVAMFGGVADAQQSSHHEVERIQVPPGTVASESRVDRDAVARLIVEQTNAFRQEQGLSKVTREEHLDQTAQYFADFMATKDLYGHEADDHTPSERAKQHGYEFCLVSENIAYQYRSTEFEGKELADRFVVGWKESPGHRRNMLEPAVTNTGVAVARSDSTGHWYAVQMFGRPRSAAIEFQITNRSELDVEYTLADRTFSLPQRYSRTHTVCRPPEVVFELPGGSQTLTPKGGDAFLVEGRGEAVRVRPAEDQSGS